MILNSYDYITNFGMPYAEDKYKELQSVKQRAWLADSKAPKWKVESFTPLELGEATSLPHPPF
jgi:hypothetical protein